MIIIYILIFFIFGGIIYGVHYAIRNDSFLHNILILIIVIIGIATLISTYIFLNDNDTNKLNENIDNEKFDDIIYANPVDSSEIFRLDDEPREDEIKEYLKEFKDNPYDDV